MKNLMVEVLINKMFEDQNGNESFSYQDALDYADHNEIELSQQDHLILEQAWDNVRQINNEYERQMELETQLAHQEFELIRSRMADGLTLSEAFLGQMWSGLELPAEDLKQLSMNDYKRITN